MIVADAEFLVNAESLTFFCDEMMVHLDERTRRLFAGSLARALGHGGIRAVADASGLNVDTVSRGGMEIDEGAAVSDRVRGPGGGRPSIVDTDPAALTALEALVSPDERGDPESLLRWTVKSLRQLADGLDKAGHRVGVSAIRKLLKLLGYTYQAPAKTKEGKQHPDRNGQFEHINATAKVRIDAGEPVVSVDAKKKELIGDYKNKGRTLRPKGDPIRVSTHDFPDPELGKAIPYGVLDLGTNEGWVSVGQDHDTAQFAVETLRRWWSQIGSIAYPDATTLLITADGGGSNSYRARLWKAELAALADETGLEITVCHFPPGTSKWNKIEHRLFSQISSNWRGETLISIEVVLELIAATTTRSGLTVRSDHDTNLYPKGIKVSDEELAMLNIVADDWHGEWNYTLLPNSV